MTTPNRIIRVIPRPPTEVLQWASFLAASPLDERDVIAVGSALAAEGALGALTLIEANRALGSLEPLDDVGRAHCWVTMRTSIHAIEHFTGASKVMLGVLHRHDPVYLADAFDKPIVTDRSVKDWWTVSNVVAELAGLEPATLAERNAVREMLRDRGERLRPDLRHRLGHAPIIRAAVMGFLASTDVSGMDEIAESLAWLRASDDHDALHREIDRLWLGAELHRLARTLGAPTGGRPAPGSHARAEQQ